MKICILSMQRVQNFGSLLQSYALKKTLEQMGHDVSFLDIERREEDNWLLEDRKNCYNAESEGHGVLAKVKKLDKYIINRLRNKAYAKIQNICFSHFRASMLGMDKVSNIGHFECCVIGSDEVFNCMAGAKWGFTSQIFGDVKQADRVITYAASCGATVLEDLPEAVASRIRESFENISAFSVRDRNTKHFVSGLSEKIVSEHLDPVLIGDFTEEVEKTKLPENLPERYCVIYSYHNRIYQKEDIKAIQKFCQMNNLEIITVGAPQMWVNKFVVMDPFQVLRVFENATFVITDTFHGTIFSARYAERFATMVRESNRNKLGDLIKQLGVEKHRVTSFDQLEAVYAHENDRDRIAELCTQERKRSMQYLKDNLLNLRGN